MKLYFTLCTSDQSLLGIQMAKAHIIDEKNKQIDRLELIAIGFIFFQINIIW
jgi:hypothetical protein